MDNVNKRNLMSEMGDQFRNWAEVYFSKESKMLDIPISRADSFEDYKRIAGGKKNANNFKKALNAFCKLNNYILNPKELDSVKDGRIIKSSYGKTVEYFYIKTLLDPLQAEQAAPNTPDYEDEDDQPY